MIKPGNIIRGWLKSLGFIQVSSAEKELSKLRLKICGKCEWAKETEILAAINGDIQYENQLQCTKCFCPCLQKSLVVDEKCPLEHW